MPIKFRNYINDATFGEDYFKLRDFLVQLDNHNYHYGRWDWMITHSYLDKTGLNKIGLWEHNGQIVAVATYDCMLGKAYLLALPGFEGLRGEMLSYAKTALAKDGAFCVMILDGDMNFQNIAAAQGFYPTQDREYDAIFPIGYASTRYTLPDGFKIVSFRDKYDLYQYGQVLWRGFNHEANGEGVFTLPEDDLPLYDGTLRRPNVNLDIKIAVVAPNGDFVSHCGMWYDINSQSALVEPVATDPAYRKMGLGKAAVLEAIRRCGELGAKRAFVGSSQLFYYHIGFRPYSTSTWWTTSK